MEINRRDLVSGLLATSVTGLLPSHALSHNISHLTNKDLQDIFAASRKDKSGKYSAAIFSLEQGDIFNVALPERGHDIAVHPLKKECVFFARRPGRFAVAITYDKNISPVWFNAKEERHFYGHGVFSPDGKLLYSTENDYENERGIIGVRDVMNGYKQIGEFSSHGLGPHDLALLSDGKTLVVANGGLLTHPDFGRKVLNLAEMEPNLSYIDINTGELLEKHVLKKDLHQLSIRHLDVGLDDKVIFGCQYQGTLSERPSLIGFHEKGKDPVLVQAPAEQHRLMNNYIGSVTVDKSGEFSAISSPKGNLVTFWGTQSQKYLGHKIISDGCGVAPTQDHGNFLLTSGFGELSKTNSDGHSELTKTVSGIHWDNHAVHLSS